MTTRQYARLVSEWIGSIGLDPRLFGTHSLRRTKATLIYRRTGNLRAVQLLLGHTKIERNGHSGQLMASQIGQANRRSAGKKLVGTVETEKRRVTSDLPPPLRVKWCCISAALVLRQERK